MRGNEGFAKAMGVFLNGDALELGRRGEEHVDDSFLLLFNAHHEPIEFTIPSGRWGEHWETVLDTSVWSIDEERPTVKPGDVVTAEPRSILALCRTPA